MLEGQPDVPRSSTACAGSRWSGIGQGARSQLAGTAGRAETARSAAAPYRAGGSGGRRPGLEISSCSGSPPPTSAASTAPSSPTPGGTARAWPPRRCAISTPCCTAPSRTPSASATWSATWPTPSLHHGAPLPSCRSGPPSSCGPSWPTLARIACTPCGCWSLRWVDVDLDAARLSPPASPGGGQLRRP
jgi:hypothetical protein